MIRVRNYFKIRVKYVLFLISFSQLICIISVFIITRTFRLCTDDTGGGPVTEGGAQRWQIRGQSGPCTPAEGCLT